MVFDSPIIDTSMNNSEDSDSLTSITQEIRQPENESEVLVKN